jgi:hypothetical protein
MPRSPTRCRPAAMRSPTDRRACEPSWRWQRQRWQGRGKRMQRTWLTEGSNWSQTDRRAKHEPHGDRRDELSMRGDDALSMSSIACAIAPASPWVRLPSVLVGWPLCFAPRSCPLTDQRSEEAAGGRRRRQTQRGIVIRPSSVPCTCAFPFPLPLCACPSLPRSGCCRRGLPTAPHSTARQQRRAATQRGKEKGQHTGIARCTAIGRTTAVRNGRADSPPLHSRSLVWFLRTCFLRSATASRTEPKLASATH